MNPPNIVTQIKKEVDQAYENRYLLSKQKRELRYYSLYLPSIVKIQRWFRKCLVRKTRYLQEEIQLQISIKQRLEKEGDKIDNRLKHAKMKEARSENMDLDEMLQSSEQNIDFNMRKILQNIVNTTNQYAKNSAMGKVLVLELRQLQKEEERLEAELQELEFQRERRQKRSQDWNAKLSQVRDRIFKENSQKKALQEKLASEYQ